MQTLNARGLMHRRTGACPLPVHWRAAWFDVRSEIYQCRRDQVRTWRGTKRSEPWSGRPRELTACMPALLLQLLRGYALSSAHPAREVFRNTRKRFQNQPAQTSSLNFFIHIRPSTASVQSSAAATRARAAFAARGPHPTAGPGVQVYAAARR